jgi:hypothetical protein
MKFLFLLTLIAITFTNCTKEEAEEEIVALSDSYIGNYKVTETRTYLDPSTSQMETSTEDYSMTIDKVDDTTVEVLGFAKCSIPSLKATASISRLNFNSSIILICGNVATYTPATSVSILKTTDGLSISYNGEQRLPGRVVPVRIVGTAVKEL